MFYYLYWTEPFIFVSRFKTICLIFTRPRDGNLVYKNTSATLKLSGTLWPNTQTWHCPSDHWGSSMCLLSPCCKPLILQNQCKRPPIQLICVVSAPLPWGPTLLPLFFSGDHAQEPGVVWTQLESCHCLGWGKLCCYTSNHIWLDTD